jgi:hypothetical protein
MQLYNIVINLINSIFIYSFIYIIKMELKLFGISFRVEIAILCIALGYIIGAHLFCSCLRITPTEGFEILNDIKNVVNNKINGYGCGKENSTFDLTGEVLSGYKLDTTNKNASPKHLTENQPGEVIPLPEGKMNLFEKTTFSPECCPSSHSNSTGCACLSFEQMNHIGTRGMNSVGVSDF